VIAVATVSMRMAGAGSGLEPSSAPITVLGVQILFITALVTGFRHSVRLPAEWRARWLFHLIRPSNQHAYLAGAKRAALVRVILPALIALMPLHVVAFGWRTALLHFGYGLLAAVVLSEACLLRYPRLPFASNYVPAMKVTTHGPILALVSLGGTYSLRGLSGSP
jgi:hypothetical protein